MLGAVCGMRTFLAPATLAWRGQIEGTPARLLLTAAAVGEAIGDKTPFVPARTSPLSLGGRTLSGALCGAAVAGASGVAVGVLGALAGTFGAHRARAALTELTGLPDPLLGVAEDALAVFVAALATR